MGFTLLAEVGINREKSVRSVRSPEGRWTVHLPAYARLEGRWIRRTVHLPVPWMPWFIAYARS